MTNLNYVTEFNVHQEALFKWHEQPGAIIRLMPPWEPVTIINKASSLENGAKASFKLNSFPYTTWHAEHLDYQPPHSFSDRQVSGPFKSWLHQHRFEQLSTDPVKSRLTDDIHFELPAGAVGRFLGMSYIKNKLNAMFHYRHQVTGRDLHTLLTLPGPVKKVAVTGSTGLVGTQLCAFLENAGHQVIRLTRNPQPTDKTQAKWSIEKGIEDSSVWDGLNAIIHLAGENIAGKSWRRGFKRKIRDSRVVSTQVLVEQMRTSSHRPQAFICASAIGYYGDRGSETMTESAVPGGDFLAQVCQEWEAATRKSDELGIRTVNGRIGVVLSPKGSILHSLLPIFNKGLGGPVGSGKQYISWIAIDDLVYAFYRLLMDESIGGPVNLVAPQPVTNLEFSKTLGKVLGTSSMLPTPSLAIKAMYGELGDAIILSSTRVLPLKLQILHHQFSYPHLEPALRHLLGKTDI